MVVRRFRWLLVLVAVLPAFGVLSGCTPSEESSTYGGYRAPVGSTKSVSAKFKVVEVTCDGQTTGVVQGAHLNALYNAAALDYLCTSSGTVRYLAEVRTGGGSSTIEQKPAAVGDQMRVVVSVSGSTATATVRNITRGWVLTRSGSTSSVSTAVVGVVPFIGSTPLPQFAPMKFTDVTVSGQPLGAASPTRVILTGSGDVVRVKPTAITDSNQFTNTWKHG